MCATVARAKNPCALSWGVWTGESPMVQIIINLDPATAMWLASMLFFALSRR
jgi:hypothetical protein